MEDKKHRAGLFQCGNCRQQFTVTVSIVFERSKVSLNKWLRATYLMASSKNDFSARQLHRSIGVTYKTAWFMFHRIHESMKGDTPADFGTGGGVVEVDETFIGREPGKEVCCGVGHKLKVLTLDDHSTGCAKRIVVNNLKVSTLLPIRKAKIAKEAVIHTDEAMQYDSLYNHFAAHKSVNQGAEEYVRGDVTT